MFLSNCHGKVPYDLWDFSFLFSEKKYDKKVLKMMIE
jgi:hypothetical protein